MIAEQTGMAVEDMVLMHGLNTLQAENELSVYGIEDGKFPLFTLQRTLSPSP